MSQETRKLKSAQVKRHMVAFATMLLGCAFVLAVVLVMNNAEPEPEAPPAQTKTSFDIVKKTPKKKKKVKRKKPKRTKRNANKIAPRPSLSTSLSGVSFGLPDLGSNALGEGSDSVLGDDRDVVMTQDTVDEPPAPRARRNPEYPARARARGVEGFVTLSLLISDRGEVESVKVLEASPAGIFDGAAKSAVRTWKFSPAMYKGGPVKVWAKQTLRFQLS